MPLPGHDHQGRKVVFIRPGASDPSKHRVFIIIVKSIEKYSIMHAIQIEQVQRASFMVWEIMAKEEEQMFVTGMHLIFDLKDFTMGHFTNMPLSTVK